MTRGLLRVALLPLLAAAAACGGPAVVAVTSCQAIDAGTCFSNEDCGASDHCTSKGTDPMTVVTCCVPGGRGSGQGGTSCTSLDDCASAVCTYTLSGALCSTSCSTDADCRAHPTLPKCIQLSAGVGDGGFVYFCGLAASP